MCERDAMDKHGTHQPRPPALEWKIKRHVLINFVNLIIS